MTGSNENAYILGVGDDELARLGFQHRIWAEQAFALWDRAGFGNGQTIIDVGCGPGFATLDLAHLVWPHGSILALDAAPRFIRHLETSATAAGLRNIKTRVGDLHNMDLPTESADGAYARWVLCFLSDPEAVVARVAAALKPGGVFAVADYYNYLALRLFPRSEAFDRVIEKVAESWRIRGGDADIAARLPGMMIRCGLEIREIKPIVRIARPGSPLWQWPELFFTNFLPTLVEMNLITPAQVTAFQADWRARSADPAAFLSTPAMVDIIAVKR